MHAVAAAVAATAAAVTVNSTLLSTPDQSVQHAAGAGSPPLNRTTRTETNIDSAIIRNVALTLSIILGLILNILVVLVVLQSRTLQRRSIFNMTLGLAFTCLLDSLLNQGITLAHSLLINWPEQPASLCVASTFFIHLFDYCIAYTCVLLAVDRVVAIRACQRTQKSLSRGLPRSNNLLGMLGIWAVAICLNLPIVTLTIPSEQRPFQFSCAAYGPRMILGFSLVIAFLTQLAPLVCLAGLFAYILRVRSRMAAQHRRILREQALQIDLRPEVEFSSAYQTKLYYRERQAREIAHSVLPLLVALGWMLLHLPYLTWTTVERLDGLGVWTPRLDVEALRSSDQSSSSSDPSLPTKTTITTTTTTRTTTTAGDGGSGGGSSTSGKMIINYYIMDSTLSSDGNLLIYRKHLATDFFPNYVPTVLFWMRCFFVVVPFVAAMASERAIRVRMIDICSGGGAAAAMCAGGGGGALGKGGGPASNRSDEAENDDSRAGGVMVDDDREAGHGRQRKTAARQERQQTKHRQNCQNVAVVADSARANSTAGGGRQGGGGGGTRAANSSSSSNPETQSGMTKTTSLPMSPRGQIRNIFFVETSHDKNSGGGTATPRLNTHWESAVSGDESAADRQLESRAKAAELEAHRWDHSDNETFLDDDEFADGRVNNVGADTAAEDIHDGGKSGRGGPDTVSIRSSRSSFSSSQPPSQSDIDSMDAISFSHASSIAGDTSSVHNYHHQHSSHNHNRKELINSTGPQDIPVIFATQEGLQIQREPSKRRQQRRPQKTGEEKGGGAKSKSRSAKLKRKLKQKFSGKSKKQQSSGTNETPHGIVKSSSSGLDSSPRKKEFVPASAASVSGIKEPHPFKSSPPVPAPRKKFAIKSVAIPQTTTRSSSSSSSNSISSLSDAFAMPTASTYKNQNARESPSNRNAAHSPHHNQDHPQRYPQFAHSHQQREQSQQSDAIMPSDFQSKSNHKSASPVHNDKFRHTDENDAGGVREPTDPRLQRQARRIQRRKRAKAPKFENKSTPLPSNSISNTTGNSGGINLHNELADLPSGKVKAAIAIFDEQKPPGNEKVNAHESSTATAAANATQQRMSKSTAIANRRRRRRTMSNAKAHQKWSADQANSTNQNDAVRTERNDAKDSNAATIPESDID